MLHFLLCQLGNLQVSLQLSLREDGLYELSHSIEQQASRIDDSTTGIVCPAYQSGKRDGGEEGGTCHLRVVEGLFHHVVSHADVGAVLQQLSRYALCQLLRQRISAPLATLDVTWRNSQQAADGVLYALNAAARIDHLRLDIEPRCLQLVDSSRIGLSVLPKRPLRIERSAPKAVCLDEDFQLSVKHLQQAVLLADRADEIRVNDALIALCLQHYCLRCTLSVGDGAEGFHLPVYLQRQGVAL